MHNVLNLLDFGEDIKQWVRMFYKSPCSTVTNKGFISEYFKLEKGVRQGCPLSLYIFIFIISIELLSHAFRNTKILREWQRNEE